MLTAASLPSPLVLADITQPGLIRPISGNATDFYDGTGNFNDISNAVYGNRRQIILYEEFLSYFTTNSTNGSSLELHNGWTSYISGSPVGIVSNPIAADAFNKTWGVWQLNCGTGSAGTAGIYLPQGFLAGLGQLDIFFRIAFSIISTSSVDQVTNYIGIVGVSGGTPQGPAAPTSGIFFTMGWSAGNAANVWQGIASSSITSQSVGPFFTPAPVAYVNTALTFYNLQISINAAWNTIAFFINGVPFGQNNLLLGTLSLATAIPTGVQMTPMICSIKGTGTTTGYGMYVDKCFMRYQIGGV